MKGKLFSRLISILLILVVQVALAICRKRTFRLCQIRKTILNLPHLRNQTNSLIENEKLRPLTNGIASAVRSLFSVFFICYIVGLL
jgi:hypothetical protein